MGKLWSQMLHWKRKQSRKRQHHHQYHHHCLLCLCLVEIIDAISQQWRSNRRTIRRHGLGRKTLLNLCIFLSYSFVCVASYISTSRSLINALVTNAFNIMNRHKQKVTSASHDIIMKGFNKLTFILGVKYNLSIFSVTSVNQTRFEYKLQNSTFES